MFWYDVSMQQLLTETEHRVIDILADYEITPDPYDAPIHAVDRAMNWPTAKTLDFIHDLQMRDIVRIVHIPGDGVMWDPKLRWEKGDAVEA
jgi:hypothetical protein